MGQSLKILDVTDVTHDVKCFAVEKPDNFSFAPGQATDVAVDRDGWRDKTRPFTFTSLNAWQTLELTIKIYPGHEGVTKEIGTLDAGDRLILGDPWGTIQYKGPGCFIAGGAGITPFIAILRDLEVKGELGGHTLLFSNKSEDDIIHWSTFDGMSGLDCIFTVTDQPRSKLARGRIDKEFLRKHLTDIGQNFYVCGPPNMVEDVTSALDDLGAETDAVVLES